MLVAGTVVEKTFAFTLVFNVVTIRPWPPPEVDLADRITIHPQCILGAFASLTSSLKSALFMLWDGAGKIISELHCIVWYCSLQTALQQGWLQSFVFALWPISLIASPFFIVYMTFCAGFLPFYTGLSLLSHLLFAHSSHAISLRPLCQILRDQGDQCTSTF